MLEFDFRLRLGDFVLHGAARQEEPRTALFGPSGCGKSTLLRCLAGLEVPEEGFIRLQGRPLFDSLAGLCVPPWRRGFGVVFQDGRLFPHMTVGANIAYGRDDSATGPSLDEVVDVLDLREFLERRPATLSGGEQQRVALARALAASPSFLLLDEPLASIDGPAKLRILTYLRQAYERWRIPFLFVSHSVTEALYLTDRCIVMERGRVADLIRPDGLLAGTAASAEPVTNILDGTVQTILDDGASAIVRCGEVVFEAVGEGLVTGDSAAVAVPARDILLATTRPRGVSTANVFRATIARLQASPCALFVVVEAGTISLTAELPLGVARGLELKPGRNLWVICNSRTVTASCAASALSRAAEVTPLFGEGSRGAVGSNRS